jgi:mono/diheme cytochrome c family protein
MAGGRRTGTTTGDRQGEGAAGVRRFGAIAGALAIASCTLVPDPTQSGSSTGLAPYVGSGDDSGTWSGSGDEGGTLFPALGTSPGFPGAPDAGQPSFGTVTVAANPPPSISGGTLLVTHDGAFAVASDPDRDVVFIVNLSTKVVSHTVTLSQGDEPGRLVEDGAGRVHVALRSGGALVTIDVAGGTILGRRSVCPAPRGVAWDSAADAVWVACATGELVSLPAAGGAATQTLVVERDLRDVVVRGGSLAVSVFRAAQVLNLDATGTVTRRDQLPSPNTLFAPHVAWRTIAGPSGTLVTVHQAESTQSIQTEQPGGYGSGGGTCGVAPSEPVSTASADAGNSFARCSISAGSAASDGGLDAGTATATSGDDGGVDAGDAAQGDAQVFQEPPPPTFPPPPGGFGPCGSAIVSSVLTVLGPDGTTLVNKTFGGTLPVDVAVSDDGALVAAVAPGNAFTSALDGLFVFSGCGSTVSSVPNGTLQLTAIAFDRASDLVVQVREPMPELLVETSSGGVIATIPLSATSRTDTGHDVFHTQAGALIACASCHPEGRDDGHVWRLNDQLRRTPSLRGTIKNTAPYHWPGDETTLTVLVNDVYTLRMGGVSLDTPTMDALNGWVQNVPALPAPAWVDSAAAARGKAIFQREDVGCGTCHAGPKLTDNATVDVGTGGAFQVPPLVGVGWRTPLFHDGCATTIADRFAACSTPQHGSIGGLSTQDVSDLISYLESL